MGALHAGEQVAVMSTITDKSITTPATHAPLTQALLPVQAGLQTPLSGVVQPAAPPSTSAATIRDQAKFIVRIEPAYRIAIAICRVTGPPGFDEVTDSVE